MAMTDNFPGLGSAAALPTDAIPAETDASCLESALAGSAMRDRASSTSRSTPKKTDLYLPLS
jgi:hypothetical protein